MKREISPTNNLITLAFCLVLITSSVDANTPVVRAVLFFSETCPHCHKVITEDLIPLIDRYGEQLIILGINTYTEQGYQLYQEAITHFQIPEERRGVPTLIVGETVLVGSLEIPMQFPGIVEQGLKSGVGIEWPDLPGLDEILEAENSTKTETDPPEAVDTPEIRTDPVIPEDNNETDLSPIDPKVQTPDPAERYNPVVSNVEGEETFEGSASPVDNQLGAGIDTQTGDQVYTEKLSISQRFARDKLGNTISVIVLLGMALSVVWMGITIAKPVPRFVQWPDWVIPILVLIGIGVALYMGYVEITSSEAVCGPVGDCNTVQQSSYAYLFGLIPIGVFGVVGYILIGLIWLVFHWAPSRWKKISSFVLWGLAVFGTLFSIYLTFLEPFVIGASCAWCLISAILMTLVLWASTHLVINAWNAKK